MKSSRTSTPLDELRRVFGEKLQEHVTLANYTTAHVGGPVDALLIAQTADELADTAARLWALEVPFTVIGSGSNLLVADSGLRGAVIVNRARNIKVDAHHTPPTVLAESGANLGGLARQVALRGLSGMEWAANIPGTVGGAVYGNAGAHGSDMQACLVLAEILHRDTGRGNWTSEQMDYQYRSSILKRTDEAAIILSARLRLNPSTPEAVQARMDEFNDRRRSSQPAGASLGSMFKNPPGDYAGRLIEAAGLKGKQIGGAQISSKHANFFINDEHATAADIYALIQLTRRTVLEQFGVKLELEVELLGDFEESE